MPFPTGQENLNHTELMRGFLRGVYELVSNALTEGRDWNGQDLFEPDLYPVLREAFPDMQAHFINLDEAVGNIPAAKIRDHALDGRQLAMRLHIVRVFADRFDATGGALPFCRLVDALKGVLDTIVNAAGSGGAVKAFVVSLQNATAK